jgi:hypothetical protein
MECATFVVARGRLRQLLCVRSDVALDSVQLAARRERGRRRLPLSSPHLSSGAGLIGAVVVQKRAQKASATAAPEPLVVRRL